VSTGTGAVLFWLWLGAAGLLAACAGGGGSVHLPPAAITAGTVTPLQLELTAWGAGWGRLSRRYRALDCHYYTARDTTQHVVPMRPVSEDHRRFVSQCTLPPLARADSAVIYWFTFTFDGQPNRRPVERIAIR
jgi:hypothetical protein